MQNLIMYTDGACINNPGPGGVGVVLISGEHRKELSAGFQLTTNNRMEMMAAIIGLESLMFATGVTVYSDSKYLVDAVTQGWARRWRANGWKRNKKDLAKNPDLWERLLNVIDKHEVQFKWVKGHAGIPENERCDQLATTAAKGTDLIVDNGYQFVNQF